MRQGKLFAIFLIVSVVSVPVIYGLTLEKGLTYRDGDDLGAIYFGDGFSCRTFRWTASQIRFSGFTYPTGGEWFNEIGFAINDNSYLNITGCTKDVITIEITSKPGTTAIGEIYTPYMIPNEVEGADSFTVVSDTLITFSQNDNTTLRVLYYEEEYSETIAQLQRGLILFYMVPMIIAGVGLKNMADGENDPEYLRTVGAVTASTLILAIVINYIFASI